MRFLPLLVALVLLWSAALAFAVWLGLTALAEPRVVDAPPRLVLRAANTMDLTGLQTLVREAGMDASGAPWRLEAGPPPGTDETPADIAIEMRAEDTRSLGRLPGGVRMERLGGDPAIVLAVPDRGVLTQRLVLPVARARLREFAEEIEAEVVERRRRRGAGVLEIQWVLARHPRGRAAPDAQPPRLEAPQLPSGAGAAGARG